VSEAVVDPERYTVTRTIRICASIGTVWDAVTRPEHISRWFGETARFDSFAVGAGGAFGWAAHGEFPVRIEEIDEPGVFAFTWGAPGVPIELGNSTTARFTLASDGDITTLTVTETGFERLRQPLASLEDNRDGWNSELDELVAYVESLA
jgi:uncharacterized protein YndB with AHSA1/START domain